MIDADTFRSVLGRFASGVTIVTTRDDDGGDHGMTVSAFCSVSLRPAARAVLRRPRARRCTGCCSGIRRFGISILSSEQEAYSRRFADRSGRPTASTASRTRAARAASCCSTTRWRISSADVVEHYDAGDHTIFIAEVERAEPLDGRPLLYYRGGYAQLER